MTMPLVNLDDRSFDSLIAEARSVISIHTPAWSDHNASDPGITLVELLAWVSEQLLYRLNLVGVGSKRAFLSLLRGTGDGTDVSIDDLDEAIRREVVELGRPRRAVTPDDFEEIALDASRAVYGDAGRVRCVAGIRVEQVGDDVRVERRSSDFTVVVVPPPDPAGTTDFSDAALAPIRARIVPACLLGSRVHVVGMIRVVLAVQATLHASEHRSDVEWLRLCRAALADRFSPWPSSAANAAGWPFGRPLFLADVVEALEMIAGVEGVSDLRLTQASMRADQFEGGEALIGIQLGVVSTVGATTRFGALSTLGPDRLFRASDGRLTGFSLRPYELVEVVLPEAGLRVVTERASDTEDLP